MGSTTTHLHDLAPPAALAAVEAWLARQSWSPGLTWCAFADPDGAIGLVPSGPDSAACLALLLSEQAAGYGVTACDPDEPVELGVFATVEAALRGIGCWMVPAVTGDPGVAQFVVAAERKRRLRQGAQARSSASAASNATRGHVVSSGERRSCADGVATGRGGEFSLASVVLAMF